jgi:hypothetical protein
MRFLLSLLLLTIVACGSPAQAPVGSPLTLPQLKFAILDSVGKPDYCDPDFYPIARVGGEEANASATYPTIKADADVYAAVLAHEHLPSGDLTDAQKLVAYRAWKVLRAVTLTQNGSEYSFEYRTAQSTSNSAQYQMVSGTVRVDGAVNITSRTPTSAKMCPICLAAATLIATPGGPVPVTDIRKGMLVWTERADGSRIAEPVLEVGSMAVPAGHLMVQLLLADGRNLLVSPGHKTADGRPAGTLKAGDELDGSTITRAELVPYQGARTYDLLPGGPTGQYWANGILLSSTLKAQET